MSESNPTPSANPETQRLFDLLADDALGQLSPDETYEMNTLLQDHPEQQGQGFEEAAALLLVAEAFAPDATAEAQRDVPEWLSEKIAAEAERFVRTPAPETENSVKPVDTTKARSGILAFIGGAVVGAVAASILVALILTTAPQELRDTQPVATADSRYQQFVENTEDVSAYPWAITEAGYEQVTGEVCWSGIAQAGYMVLDQLPANDPTEAQYQLWIVDPTRDEFPVDGGVFDVDEYLAADGRAYVPIDAKLQIDQPAAFAITLEKPGGVVKSNNPLLVVAAVQ
ncbi:MAG: anti-sigma factor [Planctomycetota bacterium]